MRKNLLLLLLSAVVFTASAQNKIQSPDEFLGYKLGSRYTLHYRVAEYFRYIAANAPNVKLQQYGKTNEDRPLLAAFITSPENSKRLEEIRRQNMDMVSGKASGGTGLPIVWLSFNVHGNEASSTEVAMQTLFDLVDPANTRTKPWLKNTVVVIDPCINPDGRDRYVNFYNPVHSRPVNPDPQSREHMEPWPGGRSSHYYFDLNRDWAWQTQKETQQRLALFNTWLPEVHVDFHEQGYNAPYYFAPAAEPFHKFITPWQREFQTTIGKNNAKYFDEKGWLYFTKERFDLLYPSYGDTYPIYNGSIGMTYEQGGIRAGLAVINSDGDTLTLTDRIAHHHSNALATIETTSANAKKVTDEFAKFFSNARNNPPGDYRSYIIKNDNTEMVKSLATLLDRNGIEYGYGSSAAGGFGFNYVTGKDERFSIAKNDLVINSYQAKSVLLNVLFEPRTTVVDSNTYDITAWALPYAYGLKAYASKQSYKPASAKPEAVFTPQNLPSAPYAYVAPWNSVTSVRFLAKLLNTGVKVRYTETPLTGSGKNYPSGSLLITRAANAALGQQLDQLVRAVADSMQISLGTLSSG
ncbi:MAG: zinc carboxypeptidase, partial [Mucilaginibacter polytrichastri]|nr:zinc carboxypeptidase [Mucilaginibacter polytrichastri]